MTTTKKAEAEAEKVPALTAKEAKARIANDKVVQSKGNQKYLDNLRALKAKVFGRK